MPGETLLCLEGPIRLTTFILHFGAGLFSLAVGFIWVSNLDNCSLPGIPEYSTNTGAPGIVGLNLIAFLLFVAMRSGYINNMPAFFQSVQASWRTLLAHMFILFLVPFINVFIALADYETLQEDTTTVIGVVTIDCPVSVDLAIYAALIQCILYAVVFVFDILMFRRTIQVLKQTG